MNQRERILAQTALPTESVFVPEWNETVLVRTIPISERDAFEAEMVEQGNGDVRARLRNIRARVVQLAAVDDAGVTLFGREDADQLGQLHPVAVDRIYEVAERLSFRRGDVAAIAKNSGAHQSESSVSS